jgi:uncharacterized protein (DUF427 family)
MSLPNPAPGFLKHSDRSMNYSHSDKTIKVLFNETILAATKSCIILIEENYSPVIYIPADDIRFEFMEKTQCSTYCPFKGTASYWNIKSHQNFEENAAWSYRNPFDEALIIKGYIAFYPNKVSTIDTY